MGLLVIAGCHAEATPDSPRPGTEMTTVSIQPTASAEPRPRVPAPVARKRPSYPVVYCTYPDTYNDPLFIEINPASRGLAAVFRHLRESHPGKDGLAGFLPRSAVPEPWRNIGAVTLVSKGLSIPATALGVGVQLGPSDDRLMIALDTKPARLSGVGAVYAVEDAANMRFTPTSPTTPLDETHPFRIAVEKARGFEAHGDDIRFEAVANFDFDGDGEEETLVWEYWMEGRFDWIVRRIQGHEEPSAHKICGDAA